MMTRLRHSILFLLLISAHLSSSAGESSFLNAAVTGLAHANKIDYITFYNNQPDQFFTQNDLKKLNNGYLESADNILYQTWEGEVSGSNLYLELYTDEHGGILKLMPGKSDAPIRRKSVTTLRTDKAFSFPHDPNTGLNPRGSDLFVKSSAVASHSAICIESSRPDSNRGLGLPMTQAYVITNPIKHPQIYKIPSPFASCLGLTQDVNGYLQLPKVTVNNSRNPKTISIEYYRLQNGQFQSTSKQITGHLTDDRIFTLAGNLQNKDVQAFVEQADLCDHFAGEWDSSLSKAEQRHIRLSVRKYCGKAQQQMRSLQKKYAGDNEIDQLIDEYQSVKSFIRRK